MFRDVAIPTFSHNPAPVVLPDGTYAIYHVGKGTGAPDGGMNCTNTTADVGEGLGSQPRFPHTIAGLGMGIRAGMGTSAEGSHGAGARTMPFPHFGHDERSSYGVHVARSLDGPWTAVPGVKGCNNPAPWVHPNDTIYLWCGDLLRADSVAGPYTKVGNQTVSGQGVVGHLEDPQIWTDKRGNWHCVFHVFQYGPNNGSCVGTHVSAHRYSEDGLNWHVVAAFRRYLFPPRLPSHLAASIFSFLFFQSRVYVGRWRDAG
jgi:hypothetical protein